MEQSSDSRPNNSTYSVALIILAMILFWQVLGHDFFIFDDAMHIYEHPQVKSFSLKALFALWKESLIAMTYTFWGIISYFFGTQNATPFHFTSILLHGLNSILCFQFIKIVLNTYYKKEVKNLNEISFWATLFFLVHPLKVETIAWASSLKDLLSSFFALSALLLFFKSRYKDIFIYDFLFIAFTCLGIFSKQNIVILPCLFVFFDLTLFKYSLLESIRKNIIVVIMGLIVGFYHIDIIAESFKFSSANLSGRFLLALESIKHYLIKFIIPYPLSFDYGKTIENFILNWESSSFFRLGPLFTLILIFSLALSFIKGKRKYFFIGLMTFLILILPTLGIITFPFQNFSTVADRFFYLPSIGFSLIIAFLFVDFKIHQNKALLGLSTIFLIIFMGITLYQIKVWEKPEKILGKTLDINPQSYPLHISYATLMKNKGDFKSAAIHYSKALNLRPNMIEPRQGLESALIKIGRYDLVEKLKIKNFINDLKRELGKAP